MYWDACGSAVKESTCNAGDLGSIPGLGRSPGEGNGYPLQYPGLESSVDCIVHAVAKSWTQLSNFHFHSPMLLFIYFLFSLLLDSTWRCGKWGSIREAGWEKTPKTFLEDSLVSLKPHITVSVMQSWYLIGSGERFWVCFWFSGHVFSFLRVWLTGRVCFSRPLQP